MDRNILRILEESCPHKAFPWYASEPFQHGDEIYSTDGRFLVIVPATEELNKKYTIKKDIEIIQECDFSVPSVNIPSKELIDFRENLPKKPSYKNVYQQDTCHDCKGVGVVKAKYRSKYTNSTYTIECTCPVCDGSGEITIATQVEDPSVMVQDEDVVIEFMGHMLDFNVFNKLIYVIKELKVDDIEVYGIGPRIIYIRINKDIKVVMCSCVPDYESRRIVKFKY